MTNVMSLQAERPETEVTEKAKRRKFGAEYKVRILREAAGCARPRVAMMSSARSNAERRCQPSDAQPGMPSAGASRATFASMSLFRIAVIARNPKDESRATPPVDALVDSGSELSWLPAELLASVAITPRQKRTFETAAGQIVTREVGYAILAAEGFETIDEVVFGEASDMALVGVRTIEGFGVMVDAIGHRLVARVTIVA